MELCDEVCLIYILQFLVCLLIFSGYNTDLSTWCDFFMFYFPYSQYFRMINVFKKWMWLSWEINLNDKSLMALLVEVLQIICLKNCSTLSASFSAFPPFLSTIASVLYRTYRILVQGWGYHHTWHMISSDIISRVSCQKGPTRHAYAWQIGPFWQNTFDMVLCKMCDCWLRLELVAYLTASYILTELMLLEFEETYLQLWFKVFQSGQTIWS